MKRHKLWCAGRWQEGAELRDVRSPFNNEVVSKTDYASASQMDEALEAAKLSFAVYKKTSRATRARLLETIRDGIVNRRAEFIDSLSNEAGKPVSNAEVEVSRAINTFTVAAEEVKRFGGEIIPLDIDASGRPFDEAVSTWVPRGPILGITPFNFPLNLVAHKVAPALASGNSILIKPAPQAPGGASLLAEIFAEAAVKVSDDRDQIPLGTFQVLSCTNEVASQAVTDPRIATVTFTGSTHVGWMLQAKAIGKKLTLELGGNAGVIINRDGDLVRAAQRCALGGFGFAGQSCISVQRVFVEKTVANAFLQELVAETKKTVAGDPQKKETIVGPVIDSRAADRIMAWIEEAKSGGAKVLAGGTRTGNVIAPTVLAHARNTDKICSEEVFGPVVVVETFDKFEDAVEAVNHSKFGLQAGVFTDSTKLIRYAIQNLEVGGVIINEVPTYRADQMPYGGVKESGLGREGLRYAMEEYSERRTVVQWHG